MHSPPPYTNHHRRAGPPPSPALIRTVCLACFVLGFILMPIYATNYHHQRSVPIGMIPLGFSAILAAVELNPRCWRRRGGAVAAAAEEGEGEPSLRRRRLVWGADVVLAVFTLALLIAGQVQVYSARRESRVLGLWCMFTLYQIFFVHLFFVFQARHLVEISISMPRIRFSSGAGAARCARCERCGIEIEERARCGQENGVTPRAYQDEAESEGVMVETARLSRPEYLDSESKSSGDSESLLSYGS